MNIIQKILLNKSRNKKESVKNESLNIALSGNKILLPEDVISDSINSYDVYIDERKKSNKFRLVVNINPFCSNVLFNPFTEIVKDEGSLNAICLNYKSGYTNNNVIGKDKTFEWSQYEAIRDTQLSNETCGFEYHCGIDIFNNHILRNKSFKAVNYNEYNSNLSIGALDTAYGDNFKKVKVNNIGNTHTYIDNNFNTIDDYMRDKDGWIISEHFPRIVKKDETHNNLETVILPLHLYQNYDIYSFRECVSEKLLEDNGWYGFKNQSTLGVTTLKNEMHQSIDVTTNFDVDKLIIECGDEDNKISITANQNTIITPIDAAKLDINKVINNKEYCDYIDMYPTRDLFSFTPKYNKFRKRLEKNWNYCITYPSKSIIRDNIGNIFPFFTNESNDGFASLKVYMFDEWTKDDNEIPLVTIYTVCQHGLMEGDLVNVYKSKKLFYEQSEVIHVIDKYIFQIYKNTSNMSDYWVEVDNRNYEKEITNGFLYENETVPKQQKIVGKGVLKVGDSYFPICESNRCNVDSDAQDISIRRVVNGVECKYYVRKFSRLPNFKFKDSEINDFTLYNDRRYESSLINKFSDPTCNFESHIGKLGFANTSYNDDSTEIVFTDDIDISYLRDNLGRPLSDVFLTIVKNNKGYKEWYGLGVDIAIDDINVEYSHCFGKVNSSFLLSDYFREMCQINDRYSNVFDVRDITANPTKIRGIKYSKDNDEINYYKDRYYYGDICCYSPIDCDEQIIQTAMHRFNTVQREIKNLQAKAYEYFGKDVSENETKYGVMYHDEIRDVENTLIFSKSGKGDPYDFFDKGSKNRKEKSEITNNDENLYHTTRDKFLDMLNFEEGYYYQPHYRIPVKTVSRELKIDKAIEYEIVYFTNNNESKFEIKTADSNYFSKNEKIVLYSRPVNEYYFITVCDIIDFNRFTCIITDENGGQKNEMDLSNINDYVLLKKHEGTPDYARLIKDGSCRYCWRDIISNGIESDERVYPFTNGAFYINRQINFFLRRQDPKKTFLGRKIGKGIYDYTPDGEDITNYPNYNPYYETNYSANEIEQC